MTNTSAVTVAAKNGPWAQLRTGTIAQASGGTAVVVVGAASFEASILVPFGVIDPGAAVPPPGALVMVGRQDASWCVLGQILGTSGNLIENGSFEDSEDGSFPVGWQFTNVTGTSAVVVINDPNPVAGLNVAQVSTSDAAASSYLYSSPVDVLAGDVLQVAAFAGGRYDEGAAETADGQLYALWFANSTNLYPTTSSADTLIETGTDLPEVPPWTSLSGSVTAPVSGVMRLALRSSISSDQRVIWDFATVRKVT